MSSIRNKFIEASQTTSPPSITLPNPGRLYTIILIDVDAPYPDKPDKSPFLHWIKTNAAVNSATGKTIADYVPMSPPKDSPPHRYHILIFEQAGKMPEQPLAVRSRANFPLSDYLKMYGSNLKLVDDIQYLSGWA